MRREITINGYNVDAGSSDIPSIVFNNPALQDISGVKLNRTTTYKIPLTDKNRKIIELIDNVNASSAFARRFHALNELRDGIPVIDNGRMRIISTGSENLEASVTWGALGTISDEIGKGNINDLPSYMIPWDDTAYFTTDEFEVGFLWFMSISNIDAGNAKLQRSVQWILPSVRVDYILDKILENVSTSISISTKLREELKQYYIPCITTNGTQEIPTTKKIVLMPDRSDTRWRWGYQPYDRTTRNYNYDMDEAYFDVVYQMLSLARDNDYFVNINVTITHPDARTGDTLEFRIGYNTGSQIAWDYKHVVYFKDTTAIIDHTGSFKIDSTHEKAEIFTQLVWIHSGYQTRLEFGNPGNTVTCTGTFTYWKKEGDGAIYGQDYDAMLNLPEISQLDFLKNIMSITGSYARFVNGIIHFDFVDTILESKPLNIEKLILTPKPDKYEYACSDYAQTNHYKYAEDDTVRLNANGIISIADETLSKEKNAVELKLGASDPVFYEIASVPVFDQPADLNENPILASSVKTRILKSRISRDEENPEGFYPRRVGVFDESMLWSNILENRYRLIRSLLNEPKVIEVDMMFSVVDLYRFNDAGLYYFWGAYWVQIETTVNGDGTAKGKFIMLN